MKKIKKIITLATFSLLLGVSGCNYLDVVPDDVATLDYAFRDRNTAERYLFTCYSYLYNIGLYNNCQNPAHLLSDEFANTVDVGYSAQRNMTENGNNKTNPVAHNWNRLYQGIRDCNIMLQNVHKIPDITPFERDRWIGETTFLKAYYHWLLFLQYGPIPVVDVNLEIDAPTEDVQVFREPVDDVINYIVSTIDKAMPFLPDDITSTTTEAGRISKIGAKAIKARVLVHAASDFYNGNIDYRLLVDKKGRQLFNQSYSRDKWVLAKTALEDAIKSATEAGYSLYEFNQTENRNMVVNDSLKYALRASIVVTDKWNKEILWAQTNSTPSQNNFINQWMAMNDNPEIASNRVQYNWAIPLTCASKNVADLYYTSNGVPILEDKDFVDWFAAPYDIKTVGDDHRYYLRLNDKTAAINFNREPRYYGSLGFDASNWYGLGRVNKDQQWYVTYYQGATTARMSTSGLLIKKMVSVRTEYPAINNGTFTQESYPFPIIRLSDLYLMMAETLNKLEEPYGNVIAYIDPVREKAGLKGVVESWSNHSIYGASSYQTPRDLERIIHRERLIEFAFEGIAFYDKRRWKELDTYLGNNTIRGWNILGCAATDENTFLQDYYRETVMWATNFKFRDNLWPIKESDMIQNPNLIQNPGW